MRNFEEDNENYYFYGNPDFESEKTLMNLGFEYVRNEFDEFGNLFEVWIKNKTK